MVIAGRGVQAELPVAGLVIPKPKITDRGLIDVDRFQLASLKTPEP